LDQLEKLGALQPTVEEVAAFFKVSKRTMIEKMKNEETKLVFERGKSLGKLNLRRTQVRHAQGTGSGAVNMSIHLGRHWLGQTDKAALELTGKNGKPIETINTTMTPEQAAAAYASTLHGEQG
jgi:hypothetical protein